MSANKREYYEQHGYVTVKNLIPVSLVNSILECYRKEILPSELPFFRQSTYSYSKNQLTEFGYVKESFLDIHDYQKHAEFSRQVRAVLCSSTMQMALKELFECESFNIVQSMFFDANTGTHPHQEWWYLDSIPNGHLIVAWIALEDIDEQAGRFYVLPTTSETLDFHSDQPGISHDQWVSRIKTYITEHPGCIDAPALKKGDVLFFNSRTVHGSLPTIDPRFSRKSITAHYIPSHFKLGNLFKERPISYKEMDGVLCYTAHPEHSELNQLKFTIEHFLRSSNLLKPLRQLKAAVSRRKS